MEKFDNIHNNKKPINEKEVSKENFINAFNDLKNAISDKKHKLYKVIGKGQESSGIAKDYYSNAIQMANDNNFIDAKLRRKINKANKGFGSIGSVNGKDHKTDIHIIPDNIDMIVGELNENAGAGTFG